SHNTLHLPSFPTRRSSDLRSLFLIVIRSGHSFLRAIPLPSGSVPSCLNPYVVLNPLLPYFVPSRHWLPVLLLISNTCARASASRSEEHTSELQSRFDLVCR